MLKKPVRLLLCLALVIPCTANAGGSMKDALSTVPSDALGCLCVPNLKSVDANYQTMIAALGLQPFVPPPANSLVTLVQQMLPFGSGLDMDGPMAVVLMPADNPFELGDKAAIILTAKEPKAVLETMGATPGEEGVWSLMLFGSPSFAAVNGSRLIFAEQSDVAKAVGASKEGLHTKLKENELKSLDGLDVAVWIGADRLLTKFKPQIDGFMNMMAMTQGAGNPMAMKQAELQKKQIGLFIDGMATLSMGLGLKESGLDLRFAFTSRPGSELRAQTKVRNTTDSLLKNLPGGKYMLAFGETADPAQVKASLSSLDDYIAIANEVEGVDKEKVGQLKQVLETWAPMITGVRASVQAVAPNDLGVFRLSTVIDTTNSTEWIKQASAAVKLLQSIIADEGLTEVAGSDLQEFVKAAKFEVNAEKIDGSEVAHMSMDLSKIDLLDEDDVEELHGVIGKEGALVRMAAADAKTIVVTFGGGSETFGSALKLAKSGASPLEDDAGIKRTSAGMAKDRYLVGYLAVDEVLKGIRHAMAAMDEEPIPIHMPPIKAPLGITGIGGDGWSQLDMFVPTPLLVAAKDAAMAFMGSQAAAPAAPAEPGN